MILTQWDQCQREDGQEIVLTCLEWFESFFHSLYSFIPSLLQHQHCALPTLVSISSRAESSSQWSLEQCFSTSALLTFWAGWGVVLRIAGWLAALLASAHWMSIAHPYPQLWPPKMSANIAECPRRQNLLELRTTILRLVKPHRYSSKASEVGLRGRNLKEQSWEHLLECQSDF